MASENAKQVARKVIEKVGKGKKVSVSKIAKETGYSNATAKNPQKITRTKSYQDEMEPVVNKMIKQREKILDQIAQVDLTDERFKDLVDSVDKLTKNIQLLSGGETERSSVEFSIVNYGDSDTV